MTIKRLLAAAAAVSLLAGAAYAQTPAPAGPPATLAVNGDSMTTLRTSPGFTTLVKALDATNLSGLLQKQPNLTVFAPTDAAFAALPPGELDRMMADKTGLQKLLTHHIINARVDSSKIKGARGPVPSVAGNNIVLDGSTEGVLKADNATIIQADVVTSNGILHAVDHIMIAGSVPETNPDAAAAEPAPDAAAVKK